MPTSFEPIIDEYSEILILGTMPSVISLREHRYYANPKNHFWNIIFSVYGAGSETDYSERYRFLLDKKIALWDVLCYAHREGSLDSAIKDEIPNDIPRLLKEYPNIKKIIFNGFAAEKYFKKYFFELYQYIKCIRVPSSSPVPGKNVKSLNEKKTEWNKALKTVYD